MQPQTKELDTLLNIVKVQPAVSILLSFAPHMGRKAAIEKNLSQSVSLARNLLFERFPSEVSLPVMFRLEQLVTQVNYNSFAKSIAIFVSATTEKILYLDIELKEWVAVDDTFHMQDLLCARRQPMQYLVMSISKEEARIFLGKDQELRCIKVNHAYNLQKNHSCITASAVMQQAGDSLAGEFMAYADTGLGMVLEHYPFPVFLLGTDAILRQFAYSSRHAAHIVSYIEGDYTNCQEDVIRSLLTPYFHNWNYLKQALVLQRAQMAKMENKLFAGLEAVHTAVDHKKGKLLLIEQGYTGSAQPASEKKLPAGYSPGHPFYIKNMVDELIEKMLRQNGDVVIVEEGRLLEYGRIALL